MSEDKEGLNPPRVPPHPDPYHIPPGGLRGEGAASGACWGFLRGHLWGEPWVRGACQEEAGPQQAAPGFT